jgi:hypothetical protein
MHTDLRKIERKVIGLTTRTQDPAVKELAGCVYEMLQTLSSLLEDRDRREAARE